MKDDWYADNRDLVKWGILWHLAISFEAAMILQVAYYRPTSWQKKLEIDGCTFPLPQAVLAHFRNIGNITSLRSKAKVMVMEGPCDNRAAYLADVLERITRLPEGTNIIFLDPDTGLQPKGKAGPQHVLETELRIIWDAMRPGAILFFYQHSNRNQSWIKEKKDQFERAIGETSGKVKLALGREIAPDVAFFFVQR